MPWTSLGRMYSFTDELAGGIFGPRESKIYKTITIKNPVLDVYGIKSVKLARRLKEEGLRKRSFVAGKLFQGVTTGSEKKYFRILIRPLCG